MCRVLKYIPELQKKVEDLEKRKEELTSANCKPGVILSGGIALAPTVSATCLNDKEIMVQVSLLSTTDAATTTTLPLSKCISVLENEGLRLISSSTFSTFGDKTYYNLHLQVHISISIRLNFCWRCLFIVDMASYILHALRQAHIPLQARYKHLT